jgi:glycosyltransferase involved in cell wall biosynthesis
MAEAFACGAPVIGFRRGSVPDVVIDGLNGFVVDEVDDAVEAVGKIERIDRKGVREDCERRFSPKVIVDQYEKLYVDLLNRRFPNPMIEPSQERKGAFAPT